jgi:hypothetical protein
MKSLSKEKSIPRKQKLQAMAHNKTSLPSPIDNKLTINGELFDQSTKKNVFNPYIRNFNVRQIAKTKAETSKILYLPKFRNLLKQTLTKRKLN